MNMTAENLRKYQEKYPLGTPKIGRFSPDKRHFQCSTQDQVTKLEEMGWKPNPFDFEVPYKPEEAESIQKYEDCFKAREPKQDLNEVERLKLELGRERAKVVALEVAQEAPRRGRPPKA